MTKTRLSAKALILYNDNLLLVRQKNSGIWLMPGGHLEQGEFIEEALKREVKEEVNLKIEFLEFYDILGDNLGEGFSNPPKPFNMLQREKDSKKKIMFDFLCTTNDISGLRLQEEEISDYKWMSKKDVEKSGFLMDKIKKLCLKAFEAHEKRCD